MPDKETKPNILPLVLVGVASFALLIYAMSNVVPNQDSDNVSISVENPINPEAELKVISSNSALAQIYATATSWAADAKAISCNGSATIAVNTAIYGYNQGKFANWNCFFYSESLQQDTTISWQNDNTQLKKAHITYTGAQGEINPNDRIFYNISDFGSSDEIMKTALNNGFDLEKNFPGIGFGSYTARQKYNGQPVWELREFDRNNPENEVRIYYFDSKTNELLDISNSN